MLVIPPLGSLGYKDHEFKSDWGSIEIPCLNKRIILANHYMKVKLKNSL